MKAKILFIGLCFNLLPVIAQKVLWEKTYSFSDFCDLKITTDGGFFLGGSSMQTTNVTKGDSTFKYLEGDFLLQKLTKDGNIQWEKRYGGLNWEVMHALERTTDGGCIMGGRRPVYSGSSLSKNKFIDDCWIVKVDKNGDVEWEKTFGGSQQDVLTSLCVTSDGGYIFTATTFSIDGDVNVPLTSGNALWVVKINGKGIIEWKNCYANTGLLSENTMITSVPKGYILASSSVITSDITSENKISMNYNNDIRIYKLDKHGKLMWEQKYGNKCNKDRITVVKPTSDGGFAFVGISRPVNMNINDSTNRNWDGWLVKLDCEGKVVWEKTFGGKGVDSFYCLLLNHKGFLLAGNTAPPRSNIGKPIENITKWWMVQTDREGNLLQKMIFDTENNNFLGSIQPTLDGGYILAGEESYSENWNLKRRIKLIKVRK